MTATDAIRKPRHRRGLVVGREVRFHGPRPEVRSVMDADGTGIRELIGWAIRYSVPYQVWDPWGEFEETMAPGACAASLAAGDDVRFLVNHEGLPLARTAAGTLDLAESAEGLAVTARLDGRQSVANDLCIAVERGDLTQMSVGFEVVADEWDDTYTQRTIHAIRLLDVSGVTYPASPTTSLALAARSVLAMPAQSRARTVRLWQVAKELREGKVLSQANSDLLMQALEALHSADDVDIPAIVEALQKIDEAVDAGQKAVSEVLDVADPDDDEGRGDDSDDDDADGQDADGTEGSGDGNAPGVGAQDGTDARADSSVVETAAAGTSTVPADVPVARSSARLALEADLIRYRTAA